MQRVACCGVTNAFEGKPGVTRRFILVALLIFGANLACAGPYEDLNRLDELQLQINGIGEEFARLAYRFRTGDTRLLMAATHLAGETLMASVQIERIKDVIMAVAVLQCDERSRNFFRAQARSSFGKNGVAAFLALRSSEVGLWQSLVEDAEVTRHASRLRDALNEAERAVEQLGNVYAR